MGWDDGEQTSLRGETKMKLASFLSQKVYNETGIFPFPEGVWIHLLGKERCQFHFCLSS